MQSDVSYAGILLYLVCRIRRKANAIKFDIEDIVFTDRHSQSTDLLQIAYGSGRETRNSIRSNVPMNIRMEEMRMSISVEKSLRDSVSRALYDINTTVE